MKRLVLTSLCVLFFAGTALADWNPGDPNKYVQLPDLSTNGVDVISASRVSSPEGILADDFPCTTTGYVRDIHIWGSWLGDWLPHEGGTGSAANVSFYLSIYSDIPANGQGYSSPGQRLWDTYIESGDFTVRKYATAQEAFYFPAAGGDGEYYPNDHNGVWQYNFVLEDLFYQEGTPLNPVVYWLGVRAIAPDADAIFGWKTSTNHWNDDAVFWNTTSGSWQELRYPMTYGGESMDMAFVITPEPATICLLGLGALSLLRRKRSV